MYKFNLQFFAEEETGIDTVTTEDVETGAEQQKTFTQDQVNDIISKRIERIEKRYEKMMTDTDSLKTREAELLAREMAFNQKELKANAITTLSSSGLPYDISESLVEHLKLDKDTNLEELAGSLLGMFKVGVNNAVNERIRGKTPLGASSASSPTDNLKNIFMRR